jgi:hypothetical protein
MSLLRSLPSLFPPPDLTPWCQRCGEPMRLIRAQPAYFYEGVDECIYSCDCGEIDTQFRSK